MVEHVEDFCPELKGSRLAKSDVFDQSEIRCEQAWPCERVAPEVPGPSHRLQTETCRIVPPVCSPDDRFAARDCIRPRACLTIVRKTGLIESIRDRERPAGIGHHDGADHPS